eukprot:752288-Hanusia_phi.AAC.4
MNIYFEIQNQAVVLNWDLRVTPAFVRKIVGSLRHIGGGGAQNRTVGKEGPRRRGGHQQQVPARMPRVIFSCMSLCLDDEWASNGVGIELKKRL